MGAQEFYDFSGGLADQSTESPPNTFQLGYNLQITPDQKLQQRAGMLTGAVFTDVSLDITGFFTKSTNVATNVVDLLKVHRTKIVRGLSTELLGPSGNSGLIDSTVTSFTNVNTWNNITYFVNMISSVGAGGRPMRLIKPNASNFTNAGIVNAGLPDLAAAPTIVSSVPGAAFSYVYAFLYSYTYQIEGITFVDYGPVTYVEFTTNTKIGAGATATITLTPIVAGGTHNYDISNSFGTFRLEIYRTEFDQTDGFYRVTQQLNSAVSYVDNTSDATLLTGQLIYTDGGIVDNDEPPICGIMHTTENFMYYGDIAGEDNVVRQSKFADPDSVPLDFNAILDSKVIGIGSINNIPIAFTLAGFVYRLEGTYDDTGRGGIIGIQIGKEIHLRGHGSIRTVNNYLFFIAKDGVYGCDGQRCKKISPHLKDKFSGMAYTHPTFSYAQIHSTYNAVENRVIWSVPDNAEWLPSSIPTTNGSTRLLLQLNLEHTKNEIGSFSVLQHPQQRYALIFARTDPSIVDSIFYSGGQYGSVIFSNPFVEAVPYDITTTSGGTQSNKAIIWDYKGPGSDFGSKTMRKWVHRLNLQIENPNVLYSSTKGITIQPVSYTDFINDADFTILRWRSSGSVADLRAILDFSRRFPSKSLRASYKNVEFKNAISILTNSDTLGNVTVTGSNVVLNNFPVSQWPTLLDYTNLTVYFDYDNYTTGFPVTSSSTSDLVVTGAPTVGSHKFILKGYNIGEIFSLIGYTLMFETFGMGRPYKTADAGANA